MRRQQHANRLGLALLLRPDVVLYFPQVKRHLPSKFFAALGQLTRDGVGRHRLSQRGVIRQHDGADRAALELTQRSDAHALRAGGEITAPDGDHAVGFKPLGFDQSRYNLTGLMRRAVNDHKPYLTLPSPPVLMP